MFELLMWIASPPLVAPLGCSEDAIHAIKDPSVVRHGGAWHLFWSIRGTKRSHRIEYLTFPDWDQAGKFSRRILTLSPGYFCASQVFYFTSHQKWYLIYQVGEESRTPSLQPAWSATEDLADPDSWSKPVLLFERHPANVKMWIDFG